MGIGGGMTWQLIVIGLHFCIVVLVAIPILRDLVSDARDGNGIQWFLVALLFPLALILVALVLVVQSIAPSGVQF